MSCFCIYLLTYMHLPGKVFENMSLQQQLGEEDRTGIEWAHWKLGMSRGAHPQCTKCTISALRLKPISLLCHSTGECLKVVVILISRRIHESSAVQYYRWGWLNLSFPEEMDKVLPDWMTNEKSILSFPPRPFHVWFTDLRSLFQYNWNHIESVPNGTDSICCSALLLTRAHRALVKSSARCRE